MSARDMKIRVKHLDEANRSVILIWKTIFAVLVLLSALAFAVLTYVITSRHDISPNSHDNLIGGVYIHKIHVRIAGYLVALGQCFICVYVMGSNRLRSCGGYLAVGSTLFAAGFGTFLFSLRDRCSYSALYYCVLAVCVLCTILAVMAQSMSTYAEEGVRELKKATMDSIRSKREDARCRRYYD